MSLTTILKTEKNRANIKSWFRNKFPNPGIKKEIKILVPPKLSSSSYSSEIGTALDYLIRFNLERIQQQKIHKKPHWIAEQALFLILYKLKNFKEENIAIGYYRDQIVNKYDFQNLLSNKFQQAENDYNFFLKNGILSEKIINSAIFLSKLDIYARAGIISANFDKIEKEKIKELKKLFSIVPWDKFKSKKHCFLNPNFGKGSSLVNGADADLIIDNTIIDIKTTKKLVLKREDLNQIIGYNLLSIIGNVNDKNIEITQIGIYFARFGYLWQKRLSDYYKLDEYKNLAKEFAKLVTDKSLQLVDQGGYYNKRINYTIAKDDFKCPYCNRKSYMLNGKTNSGKFRYKCKKCGRNFSTNIEKIVSKNKFLNYTIDDKDFKCPYCNNKTYMRNGKTSSNKFRYKCKKCGRNFSTKIKK